MTIKRYDNCGEEEDEAGRWVKLKDAKLLVDLLEFAYYNLRLEVSMGECEYDFCVVCGNPDWNHKEDCKGIVWQNDVEELLTQRIYWKWKEVEKEN